MKPENTPPPTKEDSFLVGGGFLLLAIPYPLI